MDLPVTVHPSRLAPAYVRSYIWPPVVSIIIVSVVYFGADYLRFLPFSPYYILLAALLPFIKTFQVEVGRRHREYEFHRDRVIIREGLETVEQQDVLYENVTDIHSFTTLWEKFFDVGNLEISVAGQDRPFTVVGLRYPQRYEDLIMGDYSPQDAEGVREEMEELENRYDNGEIGREEYEQQYYYLKGKLDALEGEG